MQDARTVKLGGWREACPLHGTQLHMAALPGSGCLVCAREGLGLPALVSIVTLAGPAEAARP